MINKKWFAPILPYFAVWAGLFFFKNAWCTLAGFHIAILFVIAITRPDIPIRILFRSQYPKWILFSVLFCSTSGLGLYFFWNMFGVDHDLPEQLRLIGLYSTSWFPFITYFSLVNPFIEEYFWRGMLGKVTRKLYIGDLSYAGYHAMILWGRTNLLSTLFAVMILVSVGWLWRQLYHKDQGLLAAVLGHMAADFSILLTIYQMTN